MGELFTAALVANWAQETGHLVLHPAWIWGVVVGTGWIASAVVGLRTGRRGSVRTLGGRILAGIWVGTGVTLTMAGLLGTAAGALAGQAMLGLTAAAVGGALFASSFVLRPYPFRLLALLWWAGAVALFLWHEPAANLLLAGMMALLLLAPGIWLVLDGRDAGAREAGSAARVTS